MSESQNLVAEIEALGTKLVEREIKHHAPLHRSGTCRRTRALRHPLRRPRAPDRPPRPRQDAPRLHALTVLGLQGSRVQFTPDLMPADILGSEVLETASDGSRAFKFIEGPVFCQLLMADEINRASPRTQSALLQAMQEKSRHHRRASTPARQAVPRAGHPEPHRTGRDLSPARGAARPLPRPDRRRPIRRARRTRHPPRHDRARRRTRSPRSSPPRNSSPRRRSSGGCPSATHRRTDPRPRPRLPPRRRNGARGRAQQRRLGPRPPRRAGAHAHRPRPRAARRPPRALARGRGRHGAARARRTAWRSPSPPARGAWNSAASSTKSWAA